MILAVDTCYTGKEAQTAAVFFQNWKDAEPHTVCHDEVKEVVPYQTGLFYKRELPCILHLLKQVPLNNVEVILVDGFVFLDDEEQWGLGAYLFHALHQAIPVVGVAKTNFAPLHHLKQAVKRGKSERPLFVSSIGIGLPHAAARIAAMHGASRMPTLLRLLDQLTRKVHESGKDF